MNPDSVFHIISDSAIGTPVFLNAFFLVFFSACGTPPFSRQTVLGIFPKNPSAKLLKNRGAYS